MKLMFSLPVHEKTEVVLDTICNLMAFHDDFGIVLHFSQQFDYSSRYMNRHGFWKMLKRIPNLYVNPISFNTSWNGPGVNSLVNIHISNFNYLVDSGVDFEYFVFMSSNELYLKNGMYDFIKEYDYGSNSYPITSRPNWIQSLCANQDNVLSDVLEQLGGSEIYGAQIEGSFYRKEIFAQISARITQYTGNRILGGYACEEIYFPTVCHYLLAGSKARQYHDCVTYIPWEKNLVIDLQDIKRCVSKGTHFSVKRIPRDFNAELRRYIRCNIGKYGDDNHINIPWSAMRNDVIEESRYFFSDELLRLKEEYSHGKKSVYDVLSYAAGCTNIKDAEYLSELLLCDALGDVDSALQHLTKISMANRFILKLLQYELTGNIDVTEEEVLNRRDCLLLLRMLCRKKELAAHADILKSIYADKRHYLLLLEVFLRIEIDKRLKFFSLKNEQEIWLWYNHDIFIKCGAGIGIPKDKNGRQWPLADTDNFSPFAMYIKLVKNAVYFSIEYCALDDRYYDVILAADAESKKVTLGDFWIIKIKEGMVELGNDNKMDYQVNRILNMFCEKGDWLVKVIESCNIKP